MEAVLSEYDHDRGVNEQLRAIEGGSRQLLSVARRRIGQALDSLDEGDFASANGYLQQAFQTLSPLAQAQSSISFAATADLVKAQDIEEGMVVVGHGAVERVEITPSCGESCPGHVMVETAGYVLKYHADTEVYVERQRDGVSDG